MAVTVDVVKSVAGLYKHMQEGRLSLTRCYVDIDGECEVEKKELLCHRLHLKDCQVRVRNLKIISLEAEKDGKCLELEDCQEALLEGCTFTCASPTSDMAPYPPTRNLASAISCINSTVEIKSCSISAPGLDARGLIVEGGSLVAVTDTGFSGTFNSAVWCHGEGSKCTLTRVSVKQCGGYGALYCSHAALLEAELVEEEGNPRGCGVFVLHSESRVVLDSSRFDGNKWSGFGCRWSGGGTITNCTFDSNGQGAWAIRKSTIKDVVRSGNKVTNDFTDKSYSKVAFLFADPLSTAVVEKGLTSRGLSVEKARKLVNNERRMREATQFQAKFLSSSR